MIFANPWALLLLGLAPLIVLLHMRRRRDLPVSSVMLWRHLSSEGTTRTHWQPPRLTAALLLQLLALLLLVTALSRPQLGAGDLGHRIVVLDASLSMLATDVAPSRFDRALSTAGDLAGSLPDGARFSLVTVGARAEATVARLAGASAHDAFGDVRASHSPPDWEQAARLVAGLVRPGERTEIELLSDPAGLEAGREALDGVLPDAAIHSRSFGSQASNVGLTAASLEPLDGDGRWQVSGTLTRSPEGPSAVELEVFFEPAGTEGMLSWTAQEIAFEGEEAARFELEIEVPSAGTLQLRLAEDDLAPDNTAFFLLEEEARTVRVLHLGPAGSDLERAVQAVEGVDLFRTDVLPPDSDRYDLVILNDTVPDRAPRTNTLWLGASPTTSDSVLTAPEATRWDRLHPLSGGIDWETLELDAALSLPLLSGAVPLLESNGSPLIQTRETANGRETVVAFDLTGSNWASQPSFPVFIARLVRLVRPGLGAMVAPSCLAGQECRALPPGATNLLLTSDESLEFGSVGDGFVPSVAGLYRFTDRLGNHRFLAVNAFQGEESALGGTVAGSPPESTPSAPSARPLWRWLLLAAFVVVLIELVLASLGSERLLHPALLAARNPVGRRTRSSLALQLAALVLLALALADVVVPLPSRQREAVLVVDDLDLLGAEARSRAEAYLDEAGSGRGAVGIVSLANPSTVSVDLGTTRPNGAAAVEGNASGADSAGADLETGLELAAGMLAGSDGGRIVVLGGSLNTRGETAAALPRLLESGHHVDVVPLEEIAPGELLVEEVTVPQDVQTSQPFTLQALVFSDVERDATVVFYRAGEVLAEREVTLQRGHNRIETLLTEEEPGSVLYEVAVTAEGDPYPGNNRSGSYVEAEEGRSVLVITPHSDWGDLFANALEVQGLDAEVVGAVGSPWRMDGWLEHDVVVLLNVPSLDLHTRQQQQLQTWVAEHGGGLVILGGENAFGPGGYFQTPLEDLSPLSSRVPRDAPVVAMSFVLDRSGSMQQAVGTGTRLQIAKEATASAIELLGEESLTGVVVFDSEARELVPMQSVRNYESIVEALQTLAPSGGTSIYPGLVLALEQLQDVDAPTRHVVVMTDGLSQPGDFDILLERFREEEISVSTVATGSGADTTLLQSLARQGGGVFHATQDFEALPSILAQEALMLSSTPLEETEFTPIWSDRSGLPLTGVPDLLPPLHGYVLTTAKPQAMVHMTGPDEDPLLASWRHGLGKVVAFASHGAGAWSREWLEMPEYPLLWAQIVRNVLPTVPGPGLELQIRRAGDEARLTVEAVSPDGSPASGLALEAVVEGPEEDIRTLSLRETSPGRYESELALELPGAYRFRVSTREESADFEPVERSFHVPYPSRYVFSKQDAAPLLALVEATGGRVLLGDEPVFPGSPELRWRRVSGGALWIAAAVALLLAALVFRYAPWPARRSGTAGSPRSRTAHPSRWERKQG